MVEGSHIIRDGCKADAAGMNPKYLRRGIEMAVNTVVADLEKRLRKVKTSEVIAQVGTISFNGDSEVGAILGEAMEKVCNARLPPVQTETHARNRR